MPLSSPDVVETISYEMLMLGAATFDLSGLPKEYFTLTDGNKNITWVQTVFQALGLRSLLSSSLKMENFSHAIVRGAAGTAVVVRQQNGYLALLLEPHMSFDAESTIAWARQFNSNILKKNPRFQVV